MAILHRWQDGDNEPAWEPSEQDIAEAFAVIAEIEDLERQADDWRRMQPEADDDCE